MSHLNERLPIFTERFRELKGERNDTEFAEFLGISRQTVGFFGNGNRLPDAVTLVKISQKCGVSADWLLGLSHVRGTEDEIKLACEHTGLTEDSVSLLNECFCNSSKKQISKAIVAIVNDILEAESDSLTLHFAVSLALNAAQHCKVIPGPRDGELLLLPHSDNGKEYNAIKDKAEEYGFLVYPPDMAVRYYIDLAKTDISNIVQRAMWSLCCTLAVQDKESEKIKNRPRRY